MEFFIIEEGNLLQAFIDLLKAKAQSGVDVRIIIPGTTDNKIIYALTLYNAEKLVKNGVRIYTYSPGFIHSKVMFSDDECAVVGSINMDFRSLYQNYECGVYIGCSETLRAIAMDFKSAFAESREITTGNIRGRNIFNRIMLTILRLFAPLM